MPPDAHASIPTALGNFEVLGFEVPGRDEPLIALQRGSLRNRPAPLVRLQSSCLTAEVFGSLYCDCGEQLHAAMAMVASEECGLIIHLPQEGRGNGLIAKLRIYNWMQSNYPSSDDACRALGYPIEKRSYEGAASILRAMKLTRIRLLTNNPDKVASLRAYGIDVLRVPLRVGANVHNHEYLLEKQIRHHHDLRMDDSEETASAAAEAVAP